MSNKSGWAALMAGTVLAGVGAAAVYVSRAGIKPIVGLQPIRAGARRWVPRPAAAGAVQGALSVEPSRYPEVRRDESVEENLHGVTIADPYRWLEDPDAPETKKFVEVQNELSQSVLAECETRGRFEKLLERLMDYEKFGTPFRKGARYYYTHNTGLQAQHVVYSRRGLDGEARVLLDPNTLSEDGTVALSSWSFSEDGSLMAYALSSGGTDWRSVRVLRVDAESGEPTELEDVLEHVKFSSLAWTHDGRGFFYHRYDPPATGDAGTETGRAENQQLAYHELGTPQSADPVLLTIPDHPDWMTGAELTQDGRYLLLTVSYGTEPTNLVWYVDLHALHTAPGTRFPDFPRYDIAGGALRMPFVKLVDEFTAQYTYVGSHGSQWTFLTNAGAPRYRLLRVDIDAPEREWTTVLAEHDRDLLEWASLLADGKLVVAYLRNVQAHLELRDFDSGDHLTDLELPGIGTVAGFSGDHKSTEYFFTFQGFTEPGATFRGDAANPSMKPALYRRIKTVGFSPDDFETEQVFATSRDGTRVPMFIISSRRGAGTENDPRPTLLYGYGGFNISLTPSFSAARLAWLLAYGGVAAVANLRGGGEYGTAWRDAGSKQHKQNVFDDFIACAEHLVAARRASPSTLVIQGGSNGGLLVAACAEQRPDLFAAVLAQVGVMDLLRFHKFTIGHAWVTDYGNPERRRDFNWLLPLSPLHNVAAPRDGGQYPAMLLTTGDHDDRVVPLHTLKLTATLQHVLGRVARVQRNPILARVDVRAGHGAGKPTAKVIAEVADMYAFAAAAVGARWAPRGDGADARADA